MTICSGTLLAWYLCLMSLFTAYGYFLCNKAELPTFQVASTSTTVKNFGSDHVTADLRIGLVVNHVNEWGRMSYNNISGSVFHNDNNHPRLLHHGALLPFKQEKLNVREVSASWADVAVKVEYAIAADDGKSGVAFLNLELKATMSFKGLTWVKPGTTQIEVVCEDLEVQFSSNSTTDLRFCPLCDCRVDAASTMWRRNI